MRVAFYGRVSTEEQADRGNITSQVAFAHEFFKLHSDADNITGYELYLDDGVSGTLPLDERPEGARLLQDARLGRFSAVYFYRLDRLARSTQVVLNTYYELEKFGISIKSMTEAFDTGTPVGKFFMTLLASIAALERETILERTQMGKLRKAREGCWTSGPPPFGYRIGTDKKLVVFPPEAETIRLIFKLYNEGMTMASIAEYLNAIGAATPNLSKKNKTVSTGLWQAGHISIIVRSTIYTGKYETMRRSKKGRRSETVRVPAIIPDDDFEKAKRILRSKGNVARSAKGRRYLLRGLIYCGHCGLAMVGNSSGGQRFYYRCTGTVNRGYGKTCSNKQVKALDIEKAVWDEIKSFVKSPGSVVEKVKETLLNEKKLHSKPENELVLIEKLILQKVIAREKFLSLLAKSVISGQEAEKQLKILASELESLKRRRNLIKAKNVSLSNLSYNFGTQQILDKLSCIIEQIKPSTEIIKLMVKRVEVRTESQCGKRISCCDVYYRF